MKFEIKEYSNFSNACFYTVHLDGEAMPETDKFIRRFYQDEHYKEYIDTLRALIRNIGRFGAPGENRFRFEDNAHALPLQGTYSELRLYCIRCSSNTIILCGGGIKDSDTVQNSPDAYPHFQLAKKVERLFREKLGDDEIWYDGNRLGGDLFFDTDY